ncbi:MAG: type II toxin-antitoxin system VapC family toxin [Gemmatimonas sp.]
MRYWDSSAILPLIISESRSAEMLGHLDGDSSIVTWWGTRVECVSALARLEREQLLDALSLRAALARLDALGREWIEVLAIDDVRTQATRLLRTHALRAADALQLAAAIIASDFEPAALSIVSLDLRLTDAAEREGFPVLY